MKGLSIELVFIACAPSVHAALVSSCLTFFLGVPLLMLGHFSAFLWRFSSYFNIALFYLHLFFLSGFVGM